MALRDMFLSVEKIRLDKYRVEKTSPRPMDMTALSRVSRNLFGSPDEEEMRTLQKSLEVATEDKCSTWDFDLVSGVPAGTTPRTQWHWFMPSSDVTCNKTNKKTCNKTVKRRKDAVQSSKSLPGKMLTITDFYSTKRKRGDLVLSPTKKRTSKIVKTCTTSRTEPIQ